MKGRTKAILIAFGLAVGTTACIPPPSVDPRPPDPVDAVEWWWNSLDEAWQNTPHPTSDTPPQSPPVCRTTVGRPIYDFRLEGHYEIAPQPRFMTDIEWWEFCVGRHTNFSYTNRVHLWGPILVEIDKITGAANTPMSVHYDLIIGYPLFGRGTYHVNSPRLTDPAIFDRAYLVWVWERPPRP